MVFKVRDRLGCLRPVRSPSSASDCGDVRRIASSSSRFFAEQQACRYEAWSPEPGGRKRRKSLGENLCRPCGAQIVFPLYPALRLRLRAGLSWAVPRCGTGVLTLPAFHAAHCSANLHVQSCRALGGWFLWGISFPLPQTKRSSHTVRLLRAGLILWRASRSG